MVLLSIPDIGTTTYAMVGQHAGEAVSLVRCINLPLQMLSNGASLCFCQISRNMFLAPSPHELIDWSLL